MRPPEAPQGGFSSFVGTLQEHHSTVSLDGMGSTITFGSRQVFLECVLPTVLQDIQNSLSQPFSASDIPVIGATRGSPVPLPRAVNFHLRSPGSEAGSLQSDLPHPPSWANYLLFPTLGFVHMYIRNTNTLCLLSFEFLVAQEESSQNIDCQRNCQRAKPCQPQKP